MKKATIPLCFSSSSIYNLLKKVSNTLIDSLSDVFVVEILLLFTFETAISRRCRINHHTKDTMWLKTKRR